MDNRVYAVKCAGYEHAEEGMADLLAMMGGMERFASSAETIVLKVNLLQPAAPEKAVTTHPAVVAAVARMAREQGAALVIADSPGSGYRYDEKTLDRLYQTCGMTTVAEETGVRLNRDTSYEMVSFPDGKLIKRFEVITPVLKADGVFNLCKLKTHVFTGMTGAVKNIFGVIPGRKKPGYHAKLRETEHFADMLLDLVLLVSPRLSIMDAVVGMQGEGPNAGDPRRIGWLLAATSPLALDVVAGEIIGLPHENNPLLIAAENRGLCPHRLEEIEVIGADIAELRIPDFVLPFTLIGGTGISVWWQKALVPLLKSAMTTSPRARKDRCVTCGACQEGCPMNAITIVDGRYARIDKGKCIRCYCCHEMCPHEAIELRPSLLYRIANRG